MARFRPKQKVDKSCYDLAVERAEKCFNLFDKVVVSFSGGKDSTACLNIAIDAAKRAGKLPVDVFTFDEEAIPPDTVEYLHRVAKLKEINFRWYCVPIQHRNACSTKEPYWYPWEPNDKEKWVRDLPEGAITNIKGFKKGMGIPDVTHLLYGQEHGTVCQLMGIRCQESLTRLKAIACRSKTIKGEDSFLVSNDKHKWIKKAYPIYDWQSVDVWRAPQIMGWDYNTAYDVMQKFGLPLHAQRCAPPFGEQPIRGLHLYKTCWPELWAKMTQRVRGAATAARYANTVLYGIGISKEDPSKAGTTWREKTQKLIEKLPPASVAEVTKAIKAQCTAHRRLTNDPIPDSDNHPLTGYCWKIIHIIAKVGGNKFDRQSQRVNTMALIHRRKNRVPARIKDKK